MAKVIGFVPVRAGSKSIKNKNIKLFCGKPLVFWVLNAMVETKKFDAIVVATDGDEIADTVHKFGLEKVEIYRRKAENAQDTSSTESVMLEYLKVQQFEHTTTFVLVQATSPLLTANDLINGFKTLKAGNFDSLLSCVKTKRFFWKENGTAINYDFQNRPRRQDFDGMLMENGAFYINSVKNILKNKNRLSGNIGICEMPEYTDVEIDEPQDWLIAEKLMKKHILQAKKPVIKLVITDIDGVWTDGGMYYNKFDDELKKFNVSDGWGVKFLRKQNIPLAIMTGENISIVQRRAEKLKINLVYLGASDKLKLATDLCQEMNISLQDVAFIGDDLNDLPLLKAVGTSACPAQSPEYIKNQVDFVMSKKGGEGVFREFVEKIVDFSDV